MELDELAELRKLSSKLFDAPPIDLIVQGFIDEGKEALPSVDEIQRAVPSVAAVEEMAAGFATVANAAMIGAAPDPAARSVPRSPAKPAPSSSGARAMDKAMATLQERVRVLQDERHTLVSEHAVMKVEHADMSAAHDTLRATFDEQVDSIRETAAREVKEALASSTAQRLALHKELDFVKDLAQAAEGEKRAAQSAVIQMERQLAGMRFDAETRLGELEQRSTAAAQSEAVAMSKRAELETRLSHLQQQYDELASQKRRVDEALRSVLNINESLLGRISSVDGPRARDSEHAHAALFAASSALPPSQHGPPSRGRADGGSSERDAPAADRSRIAARHAATKPAHRTSAPRAPSHPPPPHPPPSPPPFRDDAAPPASDSSSAYTLPTELLAAGAAARAKYSGAGGERVVHEVLPMRTHEDASMALDGRGYVRPTLASESGKYARAEGTGAPNTALRAAHRAAPKPPTRYVGVAEARIVWDCDGEEERQEHATAQSEEWPPQPVAAAARPPRFSRAPPPRPFYGGGGPREHGYTSARRRARGAGK